VGRAVMCGPAPIRDYLFGLLSDLSIDDLSFEVAMVADKGFRCDLQLSRLVCAELAARFMEKQRRIFPVRELPHCWACARRSVNPGDSLAGLKEVGADGR
ncbi:MAG: hypothetical protein OXH79_08590, partial [Boseongicola sp.]|nr:hypothetical protein [Boseongicola sp.]